MPVLMVACYLILTDYFFFSLQFYDILAGNQTLVPSRYMNILESLSRLPTMSKWHPDGRSLKGSVSKAFVCSLD